MHYLIIKYGKSPLAGYDDAAQFICDCVEHIPAFDVNADFNSYVPPIGTTDDCHILSNRLTEAFTINSAIEDVAYYHRIEMQKNRKKAKIADRMPTEQKILRLAAEFSRLLRKELPQQQMDAIIEANSDDDDTCATHDYLDSNEVMDNAFNRVLHISPNTENDHDAYLWNEAWGLAKKMKFDIQLIKQQTV